ncbi:MAG: type II toxin-antitoxin system VapC family toxin [Dolichospermum sp. UKL201]|jgi:PIN domain nuclease of toxin-antitoxin system|uniref:Type II toxin-antitoxin system VapC family toxin n=1 Tax=Dolichospermum flos-aquae CCAP 1403/13F TaxID=315271 RepID=A0A6H2BTK4_DOLFA|nr:type II toxin-antitoxin system VapC family toxin [Dolichospermum flos-aquae]MBS9391237.1 type II toxin-antitoxin system VapC family toxin [Dolichospermum sp. WA123]QJB42915.1 type II toxin-antitoxin system VapC family toxin [Dolichospermum flos-aquae CCAP 1403/13F]QSV56384.1 MAG: type II toxin-antitoxin system VapC family toxin [Dolichospermum sp. UKL201]
MKQLIDTHTLLWFTMGNPRISDNLRLQIENNDNLLSIASVWEMAIKHSIGKLNLEMSFDDFVEQQIIGNGITLKKINQQHISVIAQLPLHHRDPFDRMLIAQAMVENMPIISADTIFDAYPIQRLW